MNSSARVLVVSRDETLLRTRALILGAFFEVHSAGRALEATSLLHNHVFDLVVLCHSLTNAECEQLAIQAHDQNPRPMILAMSPRGDASKPWADKQLGVDAGPYGLLKKCATMLGLALKSKAKTAHV